MKFSIIMPSFNQGHFIERSIDSVLSQNHVELELIIQDGGSTDGTLSILRTISDPRVCWTSAPDAGQADAINKGMAKATGDIIGYLASDDILTNGSLDFIGKFFEKNPNYGAISGRSEFIDIQDNFVGYYGEFAGKLPKRTSARYLVRSGRSFAQPSTFWRNDHSIGAFRVDLNYVMDFEYFLRVARTTRIAITPEVFSRYRLHSDSKTIGHRENHWKEQLDVCQANGLKIWDPMYLIRVVRHLAGRQLSKVRPEWSTEFQEKNP
jgi:glycosyltransferase involved in cell wall biosynthesis